MRWVAVFILAYLALLAQTTLVRLVQIHGLGVGTVAPDLPAIVAVFLALHAGRAVDAMLAAWVLGLGLGLTASGGPGGGTVLGPMAVLYALTAGGLFRVREAFFRDRIHAQALLTLAFCLLVHGAWVTAQALRAFGYMTWPAYGEMLLQALGISVYTAVVAPLVHWALRRGQRVLMNVSAGRGRRAGA